MKNSNKPICGAKNRAGNPCEKPPLKGRSRCKLHGGATPKSQFAGAANPKHSHGLYSAALTEDEAAAWDSVPIGAVDHEIRMCKIWLARAMALDTEIGKDPHNLSNKTGLVLSEVRQSSMGEDKSTDVITRRPDTILRINVLLGRLASLEKVRVELLAADDGSEDKLPLPWIE